MNEPHLRKLRMGMVGGGPGAFIGPVHKMAAELDGKIQVVAGAFSSDPQKSRAGGILYGIEPERAYSNYLEMFRAEATLSDGIDLVTIVTPNHLHFPIAKAALEAGIHVISDKPATVTLVEALELAAIIKSTALNYALTFTYTGYPLVRHAREVLRSGILGPVRKVMVEYLQGWLTEQVELTPNKQASWRLDRGQSGAGGCIADIGVHAFNLLEYVTGLRVERFCAEMRSVVPGRQVDDDCTILLVLNNGAHGLIAASQIAAGERNGLRLRVYGEKGCLDWQQEDSNVLRLRWLNGKEELLHTGSPTLSSTAKASSRLPIGHPEGLIEALGNIYRDFANVINDAVEASQSATNLCGIEEGMRSMAFIEGTVANPLELWNRLDVYDTE